MKRLANPSISPVGQAAIAAYERFLHEAEDLNPKTIRAYLSDLRQFVAWCEGSWEAGEEQARGFSAASITTPLITRYRSYLQTVAGLRPATINRALITLKRYCAWATDQELLRRDPAKVVKMVRAEARAPRHLTDEEEEALLAAVTASGSLRDRTIITLLLHTGLRAGELCQLRPSDVSIGRRSGTLRVLGKRNKEREVPLNATARAALTEYLEQLPKDAQYLFLSEKTGQALTERALGYILKKYAEQARVADLSPHDLRHRFGYRMAEVVPLHRLAQIMGHDSLDTTMIYIRGTRQDLQREVEKITWE